MTDHQITVLTRLVFRSVGAIGIGVHFKSWSLGWAVLALSMGMPPE